MLHKVEDEDDEAPAGLVVTHCRHIVNTRTVATLWIQLPSSEEYGDFLTDVEGLLIFYNEVVATLYGERAHRRHALNPVADIEGPLEPLGLRHPPKFLHGAGLEGEPPHHC